MSPSCYKGFVHQNPGTTCLIVCRSLGFWLGFEVTLTEGRISHHASQVVWRHPVYLCEPCPRSSSIQPFSLELMTRLTRNDMISSPNLRATGPHSHSGQVLLLEYTVA